MDKNKELKLFYRGAGIVINRLTRSQTFIRSADFKNLIERINGKDCNLIKKKLINLVKVKEYAAKIELEDEIFREAMTDIIRFGDRKIDIKDYINNYEGLFNIYYLNGESEDLKYNLRELREL